MKKKKLKKEIVELRKEIKDLQTRVQVLEYRRIGTPIPLGTSNEKAMYERIVKAYKPDKDFSRVATLAVTFDRAARDEADFEEFRDHTK